MPATPTPDHVVHHDPEGHRFVLLIDGQEAGFAHYTDDGSRRDFDHTVISPDFQGRGLSAPLIEAALEHAAAEGLRIVPSCSAVAHFLSAERNARFRELLAP